jgi:photosynthetic reaction center cytochrome c subunit
MRRNRLSVWLAAAGILLSLTLVFAGARAQSALPQVPASGSTASKLAEEQFKNIQALKGIPADQVVPSMQFIATSLGVECEYCHVRGAFEKDDKKTKITARKMIGMMMAINKENFEGHREVTCYSCHRGAKDPVGTPIITDEDPAPGAAEEKAAGEWKPALPTADQLLDKYLAAIGGADAAKDHQPRTIPAEVYSKAPNKRLAVMHLQGGNSITAFDGKQGRLSVPSRVHMMSAAENDAARIDADLYFAVHVKMLYEKFGVEASEKIDGHDT